MKLRTLKRMMLRSASAAAGALVLSAPAAASPQYGGPGGAAPATEAAAPARADVPEELLAGRPGASLKDAGPGNASAVPPFAETAAEAAGETAAEAVTEADTETAPAAVTEAQTEGEAASETVPEAEAETEAASKTVPEAETEAGTETETETETEAETEELILIPSEEEELELLRKQEAALRRLLDGPAGFFIPCAQDFSSGATRLYALADYRFLSGFRPPQPAPAIGSLQIALEEQTGSYDGTWSIYVKNLRTGDQLSVGAASMKSASTMKLFIMGAVYEDIHLGHIERTQDVVALLTDMIEVSSNSAANKLLLLLGDGSYADGAERVNRFIRKQGFSSLTHEYNGFEDSAAVVDASSTNCVLPADCGRFLEKIYHREFISRSVCNEIEQMMLNQQTRYKIPKGLPEGVSVGNKTGETDTVENDVAIVYGPKSDYILCVFSADWQDKNRAMDRIQDVSRTVYDFFDDPAYYGEGGEDGTDIMLELVSIRRGEKAILAQARALQEERSASETEAASFAGGPAGTEEASFEEETSDGLFVPFLDFIPLIDAEDEEAGTEGED